MSATAVGAVRPDSDQSNVFVSMAEAYGDQHYVNEIEEDMDVSLHDFDPQAHEPVQQGTRADLVCHGKM
jgi:hypothetical protein